MVYTWGSIGAWLMAWEALCTWLRYVGFGHNNAADVTDDTSVADGNIEPPMKPLDSALKMGLDTMLWCYLDINSTWSTTILLGVSMWCRCANLKTQNRARRWKKLGLIFRKIFLVQRTGWRTFVGGIIPVGLSISFSLCFFLQELLRTTHWWC